MDARGILMIRDISQLASRLQISDNLFINKNAETNSSKNFENFPLQVTESFLQKIQPCNSKDPLLQQILPTFKELKTKKGYSADPLEEKNFFKFPGLLHKYHGRVLILVTDKCAIHCRFCFRKVTKKNNKSLNWQAIQQYIQSDINISEVILSGGDPLMLSDTQVQEIINNLSKIAHLKRVRIHTRIPIALPERITENLLTILNETRLQIIFVIHCNHASEIDYKTAAAFKIISVAKNPMFNQSVLLKGINDSVESLVKLSEILWSNGIIPYYLHFLDKVIGTEHFFVSRKKAKTLYREMQRLLPGYLVPKMVYEKAGEKSKVLL